MTNLSTARQVPITMIQGKKSKEIIFSEEEKTAYAMLRDFLKTQKSAQFTATTSRVFNEVATWMRDAKTSEMGTSGRYVPAGDTTHPHGSYVYLTSTKGRFTLFMAGLPASNVR